MTPVQEPITGKAKKLPINVDENIYKALESFYTAFNERDFDLMEENWLNSEEIAMDNPLGGIKRGWEELQSIYKRIFSGKASVYVEFYDYTIMTLEGGFCAVGRERGYVDVDGTRIELAIRTSRVYKEIEGHYRQIHHHGSIENSDLLEQYQNLVG